jgi:hypothetical protein
MGEWRYSSIILILSTRWKRAVIFIHQQLYPQEKEVPEPNL